MNAHADMLIVVGHNGCNIPRGIYRSLVSGEKKVSSFLFTKTSANKRLFIICLQSPIWVCGCKGTKKIAYAQGLCDFFGVECKDRQQSCSLEDARYTRYSLRAPHNATSVIGDPAEFKGKDTQIYLGK